MKFLVISSDFYGYGSSIANTLRRHGFDANLLSMNKNGFIPYIRDKSLPRLGIFGPTRYSLEKFQSKIRKYIRDNKYNAIIAFLGDIIITPDTLEFVKIHSPATERILWLSDKFERFTGYKELLPYFTRIFTFELRDIQIIKKIYNGYVEHMMLFFDDSHYYPFISDKDIDFLFIGAWCGPYYKNRREVLEYLSEICDKDNFKLVIIGPNGWGNPMGYFRDLVYAKKFFKYVYPGGISHKEINTYYQRSKIILNIPIDWQTDGYPMRLFEVPGSGNCLLTQYMPGLENVYDCLNEIVIFHNLDELKKECLELLFNEKKRTFIAKNGYHRSTNEHTLSHRLKMILDSIGIFMNIESKLNRRFIYPIFDGDRRIIT